MSREIKFRAWDTKSKNWYGDMSTRIQFASTAGEFNKFAPEFTVLERESGFPDAQLKNTNKPVGDLVFQQFTGLLDKNGVEIYEGDIISQEIDYLEYLEPIMTDEGLGYKSTKKHKGLTFWSIIWYNNGWGLRYIKSNVTESIDARLGQAPITDFNFSINDIMGYKKYTLNWHGYQYVDGEQLVVGNIFQNPELLTK